MCWSGTGKAQMRDSNATLPGYSRFNSQTRGIFIPASSQIWRLRSDPV